MLSEREYMHWPVSKRHRVFRAPWFAVIIAANIITFLVQVVGSGTQYRFVIEDYLSLMPAELLRGRVWQLLTYQFLHGSLVHLTLNMIGLYFFGRAIEEQCRSKRFLTIYLGSGFAGGLLQTLWAYIPFIGIQNTHVVGASAGVFGLVAAYAILNSTASITVLVFFVIPVTIRARYLLWIEIVLALWGMLDTSSSIAHAAHLGGMLFGIAYAKAILNGLTPTTIIGSLRPRIYPRNFLPMREKNKSTISIHDIDNIPPEELLEKSIDPILDKIATHGIQSLTEQERRILELARERITKKR